jgi:hypothetical protein
MAVAYQSSQTATATSTSVTVTKPTSTADGDLLVGALMTDGAGRTITPPSGWTTLIEDDGSGSMRGIYYKKAGGSEPADYTWSMDGGSDQMVGTITRITGQGANTADVILSNSGVTSGTSASQTVTATVTPYSRTSDILMLFFFQDQPSGIQNVTAQAIGSDDPGDWTEAYDASTAPIGVSMAYSTTRTEETATGDMSANFANEGNSKTVGGAIVMVTEDRTVTVSPAVITVTASIQAPTVSADANVSPSVITATASIQAPTVTTSNAKWNNTSKTDTSPTIANTTKS